MKQTKKRRKERSCIYIAHSTEFLVLSRVHQYDEIYIKLFFSNCIIVVNCILVLKHSVSHHSHCILTFVFISCTTLLFQDELFHCVCARLNKSSFRA